jgi:hypothetical protein
MPKLRVTGLPTLTLLSLSPATLLLIAGNLFALALAGQQKLSPWSFNAHSGHRLRSGLAQMVF